MPSEHSIFWTKAGRLNHAMRQMLGIIHFPAAIHAGRIYLGGKNRIKGRGAACH
jgi:hypothetical protein